VRDTSLYTIDGVRVPSVTEILEIAGYSNLEGIPAARLEAARLRGDDVHQWISAMVEGIVEGLEPDPNIKPRIEAFNAFAEEEGFELLESERVVVNKTYGYVGTADLRCALKKRGIKQACLEMKATYEINPEAKPQASGYGLALEDMGLGRHKRGVLHLGGDSKHTLIWCTREDDNAFLSACVAAKWKIKHRKVVFPPPEKEN
jgi:hypothetical protein